MLLAAAAAALLPPPLARAGGARASLSVGVRVVRSVVLSVRRSATAPARLEVGGRGAAGAGVFVPAAGQGRWVRAGGTGGAERGEVVVLVDGAPTAIRFTNSDGDTAAARAAAPATSIAPQ
jgi:hypothetical protein